MPAIKQSPYDLPLPVYGLEKKYIRNPRRRTGNNVTVIQFLRMISSRYGGAVSETRAISLYVTDSGWKKSDVYVPRDER